MTDDHRIAICAGSFDPITLGHEDIIRRALRLADRVIVAVAATASHAKQGMFSMDERLAMIEEVFADEPAIGAQRFDGLLVNFARSRSATLLVRGLRSVGDYEYEFQMALTNRELEPGIETVFMVPAADRSFVSSTLVREVTRLGGDPSPFVPEPVLRRLKAQAGQSPASL